MLNVNEVVNDTFDTGAAVATEFDTDATDDESSKVVLVSAVTEQNTTNKTNRDEFSLIVVPTNDPYAHTLQIWRRMMRSIWNNLK